MDSKISQLTSGTPATSDTGVMVQGGVNKKFTFGDLPISTATQTALNGKQETLVSGINIKTINGNSLLGSGDLSLSGTGDVTSASNITDNAIVRGDGGAKGVQQSSVTIDDNGNLENINGLKFDLTPNAITNTEGVVIWNATDKCLDIYDGETKLQVGQEMHVIAYNNTGSTILNGKAVYISGANGNRPTIALAKADSPITSDAILGITTQDIPNLSEGKVTISGLVNNLDTSGFIAGEAIYLSSITAGEYTSTQPQSPNWLVHMGHVVIVNATTGSIFVDPNVITQTANSVRITSGAGVAEMNNIQDFFRHSRSSGVTDGCNITDNGNGTVSIASGEGLFRETDVEDDVLIPLVIPAQSNISLNDIDVNYLYVNYNGGNPIWQVGTSIQDPNGLTKIIGFKIARDGNALNIIDLRKVNVDSNRKARRQNAEWDGYAYDGFYRSILGKSVISHTGTRNISVGAGKYFHWWNILTHNTFNTSISDTFTRFYNRSSYTKTTGLTQVDNTNYDLNGVITAMNVNRWRADDWFIVLGASAPYLCKVMGNAQYNAESDARNAPFPATLPARIEGACVYLGRTTIQQGATSFTPYPAGSLNLSTGTPSDINSIGGTPLLVSNGGTGATSLTGILKGNGTSAFTAVTAPTGTIVGTTDTQTLTNKTFDDEFRAKQIATPSNPSAGYNKLYFKNDDKLYKLTSGGTETEIGAGGASFDGIKGFPAVDIYGEISGTLVGELTATASGTFNEVRMVTDTRTTGTTTITVKKNGTSIGTVTVTSATSATNGKYIGTSSGITASYVDGDVIRYERTDTGSPAGTGLHITNL